MAGIQTIAEPLTSRGTDSTENRFYCWQPLRLVARSRWFEFFQAQPRVNGPIESDGVGDYFLRAIRTDLSEDRRWQAIDRLSRRILASEALNFPGAMPVLDAELDRAPFYVVEPYNSGRSMNIWPRDWFARTPSRILWILRQVAEILVACHDAARAHLGVAPEHMLINRDGKISLTGWTHSHQVGQRVWQAIESCDDVWAMAPEVAQAEYRAAPSADVYSLGVVAYRLFVGEWPFAGDDRLMVMAGHRSRIPVEMQAAQPACPGPFNQLVTHMLAKNPIRRPNIKSVLDALISIEIDHLHDHQPLASVERVV